MEMLHEFGGNVVSFVDRAGEMIFPAVNQVDAYWEGLRDGRLMPERAEVDPRGLDSALEYAFMLEHVALGVARVRVAGMHLTDLLGMEVRGMPLTAFFEPEARVRIGKVLDRVVNAHQVADIHLSSGHGIGRPALRARLYLAPLGNGGQGYPRILGCLQSEGRIGRAPRRFGIERMHLRRIVAAAGQGIPAPSAEHPKPAEPRAFAEPPAAYQPHPGTGTTPPRDADGRPRLRLVKSDD